MTWEPQSEPEYRGGRTWAPASARSDGLMSRLQPAEGWAAVPLTVLACMIIGWSISDAKWVLGEEGLTGFLIWIAALAAIWGWVSARLISHRWLAHLLGAALAAIVLPIVVGYAIAPGSSDPKAAYDATGHSVWKAYVDLVWNRYLQTQEVGHFSLFIGIFVWATAQTASYSVFGHHRPVNAVLLLAVVFVGNMALTVNDQFFGLVLFSLVALALLLQSHAADERTAWLRHRIWRPNDTHVPHLRGGMAFAGIAVSASLVFTGVASSAPLEGVWPGVSDNFRDFADQIVRFLPPSTTGRFDPAGDFGTSAPILTNWNPQNDLEFSAQSQDDRPVFHWRMIAYDYFGKNGWQVNSSQTKETIGSGDDLGAGTQDAPPEAGRVQRRFTITLIDKRIRQLITPNEPQSVTVDVTANRIGSGTTERTTFFSTDAASYVVTALVPTFDNTGTGITENKLRIAGTGYPTGLKTTYTQGIEFLGPEAAALLKQIMAAPSDHPLDNPYDIAKQIQNYLRDPNGPFKYQTDLRGVQDQCQGLSTADCFAKTKVGFCQQYATTMTMLLRLRGIPARYVQGYLPGPVDPRTHMQNVSKAQQHAWVEVFFPGYGWLEFDPTGNNVGQPPRIPEGPVVNPTPSPSLTPTPSDVPDATARRTRGPISGTTDETQGNTAPPTILIAALFALAAVGLVVLLFYRRSRKLETPDAVYRSLTKTASLLGYKPQPTQTIYEYVGTLGTAMPQTRPHLETVASAKVEVTYGRRVLGTDRLRTLAIARNKIRLALMRLAVRRPPIPFLRRKRRT